MEKQRWEESEKRRAEERRSEEGARKGRKVAKQCVFPMICGSGGSKSRLAKAAGAELSGQMRDDERWKAARRCGAEHISKAKCIKHTSSGPLLEVETSKKFTPLWRKAHFEVKMLKALHARTTFKGSDVFLRGRRTGFCTLPKVSKTWGFCSISKRWQAWEIWRGSAKMHFPWHAQYKRHVHQSC